MVEDEDQLGEEESLEITSDEFIQMSVQRIVEDSSAIELQVHKWLNVL